MNTNIKVDVITKLPWKLILEGGKSFNAKKGNCMQENSLILSKQKE